MNTVSSQILSPSQSLTARTFAISIVALFTLSMLSFGYIAVAENIPVTPPTPPTSPVTPPELSPTPTYDIPSPTVTLIPTITPTMTPTNTPTATLTPTLTKTPTPTVVANNVPRVITGLLTNAKVNVLYLVQIKANDLDKTDVLTLTATNVPAGLILKNCRQSITNDRKVMLCDLTGKPTKVGVYTITFTLKDSKGAISTKKLSLTVAK